MAGKDDKGREPPVAETPTGTGRRRAPTGTRRGAAAQKPAAAAGKPGTAARVTAEAPETAAKKPAPKARAKVAVKAAGKADTVSASAPKAQAKAGSSSRAAASRARTADRSDTRTGTHRKTAKPHKDKPADSGAGSGAVPDIGAADAALRPAGATAAAGAAAKNPQKQADAAQPAAAPQSPPLSQEPQFTPRTAAFVEAAFGAGSHLPEQLAQNIERIESLTQRLISALSQRPQHAPGVEAPGSELFTTATTAWMKLAAEQPERVLGQQVSYWGETLRHFAEAQAAFARGTLKAPPSDAPRDRRFSNPLWETHPFFNFVRRQYQINAQALEDATEALDLPEISDRRRISWFTRQMIDMMAPTNFLATNPDALEKALATEGESLVKGLENLVRDVEHSGGELIVSLADRDAFRVGENIGTTEGTVVARTRLYELIQYKPSTDSVHQIPLVIFPPWINKFYIMDLKPQNSLIKWIVDQGFTLFVVAWKNPDQSYADTGMADYVQSYVEVMDRVLDLTDQEKLNVVGYCIAGTTLALTLSLLKQQGDDRVNSATFFTTLTDFSDQGEFTAYLQDDFVSGIEQEVDRTGMLSAQLMTRTFSFLRANDLVWAPAIRSYMLGEAPPAFDLLFWNGDGTNLPGRMAVEYLRGLCQQNGFVHDEGFEVMGKKLRVGDVDVPLCAIACETDHIAPARDSWRGVAQMGSRDKTFILSESGHIAGIINPPSKKKYGHYTSDAGFAKGWDAWREQASHHAGSWWGRWGEWLAGHSGRMVHSRDPGQGLGAAPGEYVHERSA